MLTKSGKTFRGGVIVATIGEYLTALAVCQENLAEYLTEKGVAATADEKLNVLVQKVRQIPQTGGAANEFSLLDTSTSTSKGDTLTTYGETVYIYESTDSSVLSLSDTVSKWGGLDVQNNYIGDSDSLYGAYMSNYTQSGCNNGVLFAIPMALNAGKVLTTVNASVSSWMNQTVNIRLIAADDLESAKAKILASDFSYTSTFLFAGSTSLKDHTISVGVVTSGNYFLYLDGTVTADNSNFTYNKIEILNY